MNCLGPKISIPLPQRVFCSCFPLKILAFEISVTLGITNNPPWVGYGCFLEQHNFISLLLIKKSQKNGQLTYNRDVFLTFPQHSWCWNE